MDEWRCDCCTYLNDGQPAAAVLVNDTAHICKMSPPSSNDRIACVRVMCSCVTHEEREEKRRGKFEFAMSIDPTCTSAVCRRRESVRVYTLLLLCSPLLPALRACAAAAAVDVVCAVCDELCALSSSSLPFKFFSKKAKSNSRTLHSTRVQFVQSIEAHHFLVEWVCSCNATPRSRDQRSVAASSAIFSSSFFHVHAFARCRRRNLFPLRILLTKFV